MSLKDIVLVTTTRYDSTRDTRFLLAVKMAEDARAKGFPLVVVDSSPDEDVRKHMTERGAHVFLEMAETKMGKGVALRQAIQQAVAFNPLVIMFLEPEKYELIDYIARIAQPILAGDALIVVPRRVTTSWNSYPREQYHSEIFGNLHLRNLAILNKLLPSDAEEVDWFFGPFAFRGDLAPYFTTYPGTSWDVQMVPQIHIAKAFRDSNVFVGVPVAFQYPTTQRLEEESSPTWSAKRLQQLKLVTECMSEAMASYKNAD